MRGKRRISTGAKAMAVSMSMLVLGLTLQDLHSEGASVAVVEGAAKAERVSEISAEAISTDPIRTYNLDPINHEPPYNTMSADWGTDDIKYGYYKVPEEFVEDGGCFPEVVQAYTQCLCEKNGVSYPMVLALIERESKYQYDAEGDDGKSKGYMQIYQKWHEDRMEKLNCTDLMNPYQNIKVGIDFLAELTEQYGDERLVLMCYNRGQRNSYGTGAIDLWEQGIYETEYSKVILERKAEIEKELEVTE